MTTTDHDGNAFLGIALGLAFTAILIGLAWAVFGDGAWPYIGWLTMIAAGVYMLNICWGKR